jgi:hypothetical protein
MNAFDGENSYILEGRWAIGQMSWPPGGCNFRAAMQQVGLTSLRNVIGQHDLDEVLKERDKINALLKRNALKNTSSPRLMWLFALGDKQMSAAIQSMQRSRTSLEIAEAGLAEGPASSATRVAAATDSASVPRVGR